MPEPEYVTPVPASPAAAAPTLAELTFPASDPLAGTPEGGVQLDRAALHQPAPPSPAVRQLVLDGLQAAWAMEAAAQGWMPALGAAVGAPELRGLLDRLHAEGAFRLEQVQRALAAFGVSHGAADGAPPPAVAHLLQVLQPGAVFDLAAAFALRTDRAAAAAAYGALADLARVAGLTDALPPIQDCADSAGGCLPGLAAACAALPVPSAGDGDAPVPGEAVRLAIRPVLPLKACP